MCICADVQHVQRNINNINQGTYFFSTARRRVYILIINVIKEIKDMKKKSNKKGFTIMEMLIVVAIIAVLAAIAIPTFNSALTKSKEAADVANVRAAYAQVQVQILTDGLESAEYKTKFETALDTSKLNYTGTDHGYSYTDATNTVTYKAKKLKDSKGNSTYTWSFNDLSIAD